MRDFSAGFIIITDSNINRILGYHGEFSHGVVETQEAKPTVICMLILRKSWSEATSKNITIVRHYQWLLNIHSQPTCVWRHQRMIIIQIGKRSIFITISWNIIKARIITYTSGSDCIAPLPPGISCMNSAPLIRKNLYYWCWKFQWKSLFCKNQMIQC